MQNLKSMIVRIFKAKFQNNRPVTNTIEKLETGYFMQDLKVV